MQVIINCSEDQRYMIEEHLFKGVELQILPSERIAIYQACKQKYADMVIKSAHLNLETIQWEVKLESKHVQKEAAKINTKT